MDQLTLYYDADDRSTIFPALSVNRGIDEVLSRLEELRRAGLRVVNTARMSDEERAKRYFETTAWPSAKNIIASRSALGGRVSLSDAECPRSRFWGTTDCRRTFFPTKTKTCPARTSRSATTSCISVVFPSTATCAGRTASSISSAATKPRCRVSQVRNCLNKLARCLNCA
jgi:hypothetical protein